MAHTNARLDAMKLTLKLFFLFTLIVFNPTILASTVPSGNPSTQSIDEIHELVRNHVKQKVDQHIFEASIRLRKLSPDLRLKQCEKPLQVIDNRLDKTAGRMTIRVKCLQPKWQVFVPVTVDGKLPVVVAAKAIIKRAVITSEDVKQVLIPFKKVPSGVLVDINKAIGMRAQNAIGANETIIVRNLEPPYWVFKNKQVNIITRIGGIEVRTKGTALKSGVVDEQVAVKNSKSEKIIYGIVIAPNTVLVP